MASSTSKKKTTTKKTTGSSSSRSKQASGRKTTAKKTATRKTSGNSAKSTLENDSFFDHPDRVRDLILFAAILVSAIMFISNLGYGGIVGKAVSGFLFGVFGLLAYLFPILLVIGIFFYVSNQENLIAVFKIVFAAIFCIFLCVLVELFYSGDAPNNAVNAYQNGYVEHTGGGFFGGLIASVLVPSFGLAGAYIIDIIVIVACFFLTTGLSFVNGIHTANRKTRESVKEHQKVREEQKNQIGYTFENAPQNNTKSVSETLYGNPKKRRGSSDLGKMQTSESDGKGRSSRKISGVDLSGAVSQITSFDTTGSDEMNEVIYDLNGDPEEVSREHARVHSASQRKNSLQNRQTLQENTGEKTAADADADIIRPIRKEYAEPNIKTLNGLDDASEVSPTYVQQELDFSKPTEKGAVAEEMVAPEVKPPVASEKTVEIPKESASAPAEPVDLSTPALDYSDYVLPTPDLLSRPRNSKIGDSRSTLQDTARKLGQTLQNFGVDAHVSDVTQGPAVTRFEVVLEPGVKVSRITNLTDDIKLNLAATDIRIEAPIPGKSAVGIEVPNKESAVVTLRELVESDAFRKKDSKIAFAAGRDISGNVIISDIAKMPHVLIAGSTGSGKSVCINTIIMSILFRAKPDEVKFIMIDPKVVELSVYNDLPHMIVPVVTDAKKAAGVLAGAVKEMMDRYDLLAKARVRDMESFNSAIGKDGCIDLYDNNGNKDHVKLSKMPQIVIIVDELADLMMVASKEVEEHICRLAQLARAAGIHLVLATQRPSVNVITGLIKANMPSRIAFAVTSGVDSRTILDMNGAEKLLGHGDMLYFPQGMAKPLRVQGAYVSDAERDKVLAFIKKQINPVTRAAIESQRQENQNQFEAAENAGTVAINGNNPGSDPEVDDLLSQAAHLIVDSGKKASIGNLQRQLRIGFNRAARIMDALEEKGIVGPEMGTKPREVLVSPEELDDFLRDN